MTRDEAAAILAQACVVDPGSFYGAAGGLGLGSGLIYSDVRCPIYDLETKLFLTAESTAYVVTHECDVDQANARAFNDHLIVCPLTTVEAFVEEHSAAFKDEQLLENFLHSVAKREVNRVVYLPPGPGELSHGALAYLNALANTHVSAFEGMQPLAAVSGFGLREFDMAFEQHLRRPKSEGLAFMPPAALAI